MISGRIKSTGRSVNHVNGYKASWRLLESIENKAIKEITIDHLQSIVDTCGKNHPTLKKT